MKDCNMLINRKIECHKDVIFSNIVYSLNTISTQTPTKLWGRMKWGIWKLSLNLGRNEGVMAGKLNNQVYKHIKNLQ